MKSFPLLILSFLLLTTVTHAQDEAEYRMCTEIIIDSLESGEPDLPPGFTARAKWRG